MNQISERLLNSAEPAIRYKVLVHVLGRDPRSAEINNLRQEIKASPRVQTLLSERDEEGKIPHHPYAKWVGAHWVLAALADLGYPAGDETLIPLREQVCAWLLGPGHQKGIKAIDSRVRRCASQEGNALYALLALGLADERADEVAGRLIQWQWPDGGWNCDKRPEASHSSFHESLIPLRGLALYAASLPETVEVLAEAFLRLLARLLPEPTLQTDAPACVEATLFHQPERGRYLLSLLNAQKDLPNIPVRDIEIRLRLPGPVRRIEALPSGRVVDHRTERGRTTFIVPRLDTLAVFAVIV